MRLPTNNLAFTAIGLAAFIVLAPLLMLLLYAVRFWKARGGPAEAAPAADKPCTSGSIRTLLDALCEVRLL